MHTAIIGAGIGGLAAASLLRDAGHEVTIPDQSAEPRPLGSGLVIQPVGQAVLDRIGMGDRARSLGAPISRLEGVDQRNGQTFLDVRHDRAGGPRFGLAIHRASLFHAVVNAACSRSLSVTTDARGRGRAFRRHRRAAVETADGRSFGPFALIVDAAGARLVLPPLAARPLGYGAIWGTVPWPEATGLPRDRLTQRYFRASKMAGVLPVGRRPEEEARAAIFWSMPAAAIETRRDTPIEDWKAEVTAFWPEVAPFLETVRTHDDMVPARYAHGTLGRPYGRGIVHIGDAAHCASPQLGPGANMALLDALALSVALRRASDDPLRDYEAMRRWHVRLYQAVSWAFTPQYQSDKRVLPWLRNHVLMPVSRIPPVPRLLTRLVGGDLVPPLAGQSFP